jgi:hypothetical protein
LGLPRPPLPGPLPQYLLSPCLLTLRVSTRSRRDHPRSEGKSPKCGTTLLPLKRPRHRSPASVVGSALSPPAACMGARPRLRMDRVPKRTMRTITPSSLALARLRLGLEPRARGMLGRRVPMGEYRVTTLLMPVLPSELDRRASNPAKG